MIRHSETTKTLRARELEVSRQSLYYKQKKPDQDWQTKCLIEEVLRLHPSYGHRRLAIHLRMNKKKVRRVMRIFGIEAHRRRTQKWKRTSNIKVVYPNLLMTTYPAYENHIWAADFTHLPFQGKTVYIATVLDLFTRKVVGISIYTNHATQLVLSAYMNAIYSNPRPEIFHSDNGSEYNSYLYIKALNTLGIKISRSKPGCPWENGYQESFYSQFKIDFGDPSRFKTLGELVYEIYQTIYRYNHTRIHSALKMSPIQFADLITKRYTLANKTGV
jgi:transposase InsO family protein